MPFTRLTLWGGLASLQSESRGYEHVQGNADLRRLSPWIRGLAWLMAGLLAGLVGCASIGASSSSEQKQKVVAERAKARWDLLIRGDVGGAYQFLSTGSKAATPVDQYKAKMKPGIWREAKVGKIDCEAEICKVIMMITYDAQKMKGIETPVDETWIIENGSAWYVYR